MIEIMTSIWKSVRIKACRCSYNIKSSRNASINAARRANIKAFDNARTKVSIKLIIKTCKIDNLRDPDTKIVYNIINKKSETIQIET